MLDKIGVDQPLWRQLTSIEDAKQFCAEVQYPCLGKNLDFDQDCLN